MCWLYFLLVPVPPEKIHIYDDKRVDKTILVGPYNEGTDVNLLCEVKGGKLFFISSATTNIHNYA